MREIQTERLRIRTLKHDDLRSISLLMGNAAVMRYLRKPFSAKQSREFLEQFIPLRGTLDFGWWALTLNEDERLIGLCGLGWIEIAQRQEVELAYILSKPFWGSGMATEAARACLRYGFEQLSVERILAVTRFTNVAGRRVAEKVGMKFAGTERIANRQYLYYLMRHEDFRPDNSIYLLKN